ncbi:DUF3152 domain-containing protein [Streptomyces maoxianensis]|uniref:DUF3152 domain-containing protein n=1 Tax=Streptomyces maoxianensis TaxID=1459942 RepID=A0ABV9G5T4_9ACTN
MGRHSRKGPAPRGSESDDSSGIPPAGGPQSVGPDTGGGRRGRGAAPGSEQHTPSGYGGPSGDGPSQYGTPRARGGHPEQREAGGGWGVPQRYENRPGGQGGAGAPRVRTPLAPPRTVPTGARIPGPRREFVEAFDPPQSQSQSQAQSRPQSQQARVPRPRRDDPYASVTSWDDVPDLVSEPDVPDDDEEAPEEQPAKAGKGRTFTGIAAAAVATVLAVVVAGQVVGDGSGASSAQSAGEDREAAESPASRSVGRQAPPKAAPPAAPAAPVAYAKLMATQFSIDPKLTGSGEFEAVPGFEKAPGKGRKIRYRVDVEKALGLDGELFARAVQETLNDERSWAHGGAMTFERISSGEPEFVITLASPGTTAEWCAKSGLDTTADNVSCDSASTDRVMINAYRWAQGSETYGDKAMFPYRQMLINHEVGHRLGHGHVNCRTPGALAPVMQQQTKSLDVDGIQCKPNPWVHPTG